MDSRPARGHRSLGVGRARIARSIEVAMIIAQITDLHVVARDRLCYRRVPTNAHLADAIAHINNLDPKPDAVLASGDLTDHGRPEEYDLLREILSESITPVFVIPRYSTARPKFG